MIRTETAGVQSAGPAVICFARRALYRAPDDARAHRPVSFLQRDMSKIRR